MSREREEREREREREILRNYSKTGVPTRQVYTVCTVYSVFLQCVRYTVVLTV